MTYDQVKQAFGASTKVTQRRNFETGRWIMLDSAGYTEKLQLMIKEMWHFDNRNQPY
jgi:hypothetical protein